MSPGSRGARKSAYGRLDTLLSEQCPAWRFDSLNPALSSGSWTRIIYALSGSRPERHGLCPRQRSWELTEPNWSKPTWTTSAYVWPFCLERAKAGTATFGCRKLQPGLATHADLLFSKISRSKLRHSWCRQLEDCALLLRRNNLQPLE